MDMKGSSAAGHRQSFRALCDLLIDAVAITDDRIVPDCSEIDWSPVIALAYRHRVIATLANSRLVDDPALPDGVRAMFVQIAHGTQARTRAVGSQIAELAAQLKQAGSVPMFFKGASYGVSNLYPHPAMRHMSDIDILLPEGELPNCSRFLIEQGYAAVEKSPGAQWHHLPALAHPERPAIVELHRWPIRFPYNSMLRADEFLATATDHEVSGARVSVPSDFHSAVLAIAHGELSDRNYLLGRIDLRRFVDIALLSRRSPQTVSDERLGEWFNAHGARTAFEYHQRWMGFVDRCRAPVAAGIMSGLLYRRAHYLERHPKAQSLSVRMIRPWMALHRDIGDPILRRDLSKNLLNPGWWRRQLGVFSERR